ncbi:MAG: aminotransferase class I/II-fold pyridoxal phosphate-dependent enzyme [Rhodocyclaceae bacterium]|jgi:methionine aminotransferase|nr:aminotransferase class I/II-fold pyridoxal phosphate-dependent enzyme [Rhodocyclaceae bacterium]
MSSLVLPSRLPRVGTTIFTVMSRLASETGAINLSQGFPDFSPPPQLLERVTHHLHAGANQYAVLAGVLALREAIAEKVGRLYGASYDVGEEVTVTAGATQAIYTAIAACVRPGDEVILFSPAYDSYAPAIELNGGTPVFARLGHPDYRPDFAQLAALLSPRTRMIVLNTPLNPAGTVWTAEDMARLDELLRPTDVLVLSDEVYEHMIYTDGPSAGRHESVARLPGLRERAFVVSSFGKTYHVTGWKIGYCLAPRALMAEFRKAHQFIVFVVNHPMQCALADFMQRYPEFADELPAFYQQRRDALRTQLAGSRLRVLPCHATYFQLLDYSAISDLPDTEFAVWLTKEAGVAAIPVSAFDPVVDPAQTPRVVRLCFAKTDATLVAAGERLRRL